MESYMPKLLPEAYGELNYTFFMDELIDATVAFEVYVEKLKDSKVDSSVFLPTLSQKEALASSLMEGTQATLDGVLLNQVTPNDNDKNLKEITKVLLLSDTHY